MTEICSNQREDDVQANSNDFQPMIALVKFCFLFKYVLRCSTAYRRRKDQKKRGGGSTQTEEVTLES